MLIHDVKLSIGAITGILMAYFLGLSSPLTAGVIVLLSLGKTKKSSIDIAWVRIKAVILALVLASVIFLLLGFTVYTFGFFLVLYIPLVSQFKLEAGLIIGSVLSTHLITAEAVDFNSLLNTSALFVIGVLIAILFNLYMPNSAREIVKDQRYIEDRFREILLMIATVMRGDKNFNHEVLQEVEAFIHRALLRAQMNEDNHLLVDVSYYTSYIRMRKLQFDILNRMFELAYKVEMDLVQTHLIADLTEEFAYLLSESNSGEGLLQRLDAISAQCKGGLLPESRSEFENRAILFQYLSEFRHVVQLKREFSHEYAEKN